MDWFLADLLLHQVKPKIKKNPIAITILILNFQFNLSIFIVLSMYLGYIPWLLLLNNAANPINPAIIPKKYCINLD